MLIYILMIIISCFFCFKSLKTEDRKKKTIYQILSALPFILISAIRYDVGTDYLFRYKPGFERILSGKEVINYEIGFSLLNKFCILFTDHFQSIFVVTSILINSLIFYAIYKKSDKPMLSIIIYFIGAYYFESMNGVRQFLAMAMLMATFLWLEKGKILELMIVGIMAFFIHNISIILFIPMLFFSFLVKYKKDIKVFNYWYIIIAFFIVLIFKKPILNCLYFVMEFTRFKSYINGKFDYGDFQIIPIIVNIISYIYLYSEYQRNKEKNVDKQILVNFQFIGVLLLLLTGVNTLFLRISYMFTIFQIISVPLLSSKSNANKFILKNPLKINNLKSDFEKITGKVKTQTIKIISNIKEQVKYEKIVLKIEKIKETKIGEIKLNASLSLVLIMYLLSFMYINIFHNVEECLPYKTIIGSEYNEKA